MTPRALLYALLLGWILWTCFECYQETRVEEVHHAYGRH